MIFKNKKGQLIGKLNDGIFRKEVKRSKHLFRADKSWGIDSGVVDTLEDMACNEIRIRDTENKKVYKISFDDWKAKRTYRSFKPHGLQQFVPEGEFITS